MHLLEKYEKLQTILQELERVLVAFSGGVDSSYLLKAAIDTLGHKNVLAVVGVSPSLSQAQRDLATTVALHRQANLEEIQVGEMDDPQYVANQSDRCFHCKTHLFTTLQALGKERGFTRIICGNNADDLNDYRPGQKAGQNLGVRSPLQEAGFTKNDIRILSRQAHLPTADLPASPCLSSRLAYGVEVTIERLTQVEKAEAFLRRLGFREFRVRHHEKLARIECQPQDFPKLINDKQRQEILTTFKDLGFTFVTLDLQGFRSGALNEMISDQISS